MWLKWHGHSKDHWLGDVTISKLYQDMIVGIKNVLIVDERLTVNLQQRHQLAAWSRNRKGPAAVELDRQKSAL